MTPTPSSHSLLPTPEAYSAARMASPLAVATKALGLPCVPELTSTGGQNDSLMTVDLHNEAPNRYTRYQVAVLSEAYKITTKPTRAQHCALSKELALSERQSKIWFQNKRQRQRNALSMSQNASLKEEIKEMLESLHDAKYKSHILEIENQGLNSDLKRKSAQLEELENLKFLLHADLPDKGPARDWEGRASKRACVAG
ncbi:homeobox domain-containing protein [Chloropicon primus]|uniref:Homeobox domain-containing protein n=1 Tax=Chloropicon primus TaxID=1764295 RepID=A0A5B8MH31_9CHLO|nr:hypothetical protein A3770_03p25260 [Chloropicon primus]UPQ99219.1 homeobox domain-containing protein [Chloropicon primus]|mmetsp:Transcript_3286/g.9144  ORF Transcript_3286/g.9144 Transcript_3286/m.9144 type:complete len:199 (+) Transcript_3286:237-833(+)|eukprot:QDZ20008.1 hypothetical protein A3770_03p25260 [Chloropicon primus]